METHGAVSETPLANSLLERLPTEILELVFLYCLNLSLPRSSPLLGKRLTSNHMKTSLFLLVFPSEGPKLRHIHYLLSILGTYDSIGNLQSDILELKWATPDFVSGMTEPFLVRTMVREFKSHRLGWLDRSRSMKLDGAKRSSHKTFFDTSCKDVLDVTKEASIDIVSRFYKRTMTGGRIKEGPLTDFKEWQWPNQTATIRVDMYIAFREGRITLMAREFEELPPTNLVDYQSRLIFCVPNCRIPVKLLHGPWSDDKCEELERISRGGGRIDQTGSTMDEEVAEAGLRDAIVEEKQRAIIALVGSFTKYGIAAVGEDCPTCFPDEEVCGCTCERQFYRHCVGLTIGTDHIKLALAKDCSYPVLYSLLDALKLDIDWEDPHITAWAVQKRKEDDERGQWLLDRIAGSCITKSDLKERASIVRAQAMRHQPDETAEEDEMLRESESDNSD